MIDVNGTRHWLLLGESDWLNPKTPGLFWNGDRQELTLQPELFLFTASAGDRAPSLDDRRGAAADQFGNWYWIADTADSIRIRSTGSGQETQFWPAIDSKQPAASVFQPIAPVTASRAQHFSGLAVTEDHYLVVGTLDPPQLLRFDLYSGGDPAVLTWPSEIEFAPFDIAAAPQGGVWVLDRKNSRFWAVGRHFQILRQDGADSVLKAGADLDFQPTDPNEPRRQRGARTFPRPVDLSAAASIPSPNAVAICSLPDCTVLILETDPAARFSRIHRFRKGKPYGTPVSTDSMAALVENPAGFALRGLDMAFVAANDRLFIVGDQGNQSFAFVLSEQNGQLAAQPVSEYFPMRRFDGKALATAQDQVFYSSGSRFLPLVSQKRPRYIDRATFETKVFDGHDPDCVWHRLIVDGAIPPGTGVDIATRAANNKTVLSNLAYQAEPSLIRRGDGSEQPFASNSDCGNTWETLFQRAQGRFLQLRITLRGNGQSSPSLHSLRAYYPRFSYLNHYLPGAYRDDRVSASFLDRFLANLEGFFTVTEDRIAAVQMLFDLRSAPSEVLDWLAGWFGVTLDPAWDDYRRRLFLRHAMNFFAARGTTHGIEWALRLAVDPSVTSNMFDETSQKTVRIVEQFMTRKTPGLVLGDAADQTGLRQVSTQPRWVPASGGQDLSRRYRQALGLPASATYPIQAPDATTSTAWAAFSEASLGFVPSATPAVTSQWQDFLQRRYGTATMLQAAYAASGVTLTGAFADVPLPAALPPDGAPLLDWFQFESVVLTMARVAHRFTVLLPAPDNDFSGEAHRALQDLATRIVNLQKPAHTTFEVRFFWQMFRLGAARLGSDTLLDRTGRASLSPLRLGQSYVAEGYLAPNFPWDAPTRQLVGRQRITTLQTSWQEVKS